jgi:hypothetical protein
MSLMVMIRRCIITARWANCHKKLQGFWILNRQEIRRRWAAAFVRLLPVARGRKRPDAETEAKPATGTYQDSSVLFDALYRS